MYKKLLDAFLKQLQSKKSNYNPKKILLLNKKLKFTQNLPPHFLVTGTNGKGSTAKILASIYESAGYKCGLFLGPHLIHPVERMEVNKKPISYKEMYQIILENPKLDLSFFEYMLFIAINWFKKEKCQVIIFEAGLGAKLDATRILKPLVSILTNVSTDHLHILGPDLTNVIEHKAYVFKNAKYGICNLNNQGFNFLNSLPTTKGCSITKSKKFFKKAVLTPSGLKGELTFLKQKSNCFSSLNGAFQKDNINCAISAINLVNKQFLVSHEAIVLGLNSVKHAARFETVLQEPLILVDGAHNLDSLTKLKLSINKIYKGYKIIYCLTFKHSKDNQKLENCFKNDLLWLLVAKGFMPKENLVKHFPNKPLFKTRQAVLNEFFKINLDKKVLVFTGSLAFAGLTRAWFLKKLSN